MVVVNVLNHVERCYSNEDGTKIFKLLTKYLNKGEIVILSFEGVNSLTSSFTNTALIELLKEYDFNYIKNNLRFTNSNKNINEMIKHRFAFEVKRMKQKELITV